ncbi:transcription factor Pur-alpha 1 [Cinnamomum micranthum f. kanehirae]|uniref:Transcription factor Pur-alpha 1 n=1 Tax=Cinnamomum micranthum f. kanehirae TaxID=337451 RepID=A0A443N8T8_9MAGN|nr:transcription factor Pur-alpha 1 [Cinnamomum micranthum f. kanehirae]
MEGGGGGSGGGNDAELVSKTLQVEHKLFYFDLKENPRGRYLKISEKTAATRSTIILPVGAIVWFLDLFDYYVNNDDQEVFSKELQLDAKVFYFDIGENKRGRFLKISEASVNRNRSTIIVPAGSGRDEGWAAFRNILAEINDASQYIAPNQQNSDPSEQLAGLSDDVGAGFISGHSTQPASSSELNADRSVELPSPDEVGSMGLSKVIRADQKRFFFDLGSNNRGHFLKISEVAGADRSSIILPLSGLKQFHEMVGHFVEITKDRLEGMTGANIRTVESSQR